jgi:uncharacterized protein (TIGR00661 family)
MSSKPKLVFALASAGMGHATRDIPLLERLEKNYEVHIFCSGQANKWLGSMFENVHQNHAIKSASVGGKINIGLVVLRAFAEIPKSFFYIYTIAWFILKHRPVAVITDFEAHSTYGALLVRWFYKIPIISCDHWTTLRFSRRPFEFNSEEMLELGRWQKSIKMVVPYADRYLVHKTMQTELSDPRARYVHTPVRDSFLEAGKSPTTDGEVVVSMGHLLSESVTKVLETSDLKFLIYGSKNPRIEKNVEYRAFDEKQFIESLRRAPFLIVSANSSAVDGLAFKKPLLYLPNSGQFEQYYCGKMYESIGVAKLVSELSAEVITDFSKNLTPYRQKAEALDIFDNDALYEEILTAIKELG